MLKFKIFSTLTGTNLHIHQNYAWHSDILHGRDTKISNLVEFNFRILFFIALLLKRIIIKKKIDHLIRMKFHKDIFKATDKRLIKIA